MLFPTKFWHFMKTARNNTVSWYISVTSAATWLFVDISVITFETTNLVITDLYKWYIFWKSYSRTLFFNVKCSDRMLSNITVYYFPWFVSARYHRLFNVLYRTYTYNLYHIMLCTWYFISLNCRKSYKIC